MADDTADWSAFDVGSLPPPPPRDPSPVRLVTSRAGAGEPSSASVVDETTDEEVPQAKETAEPKGRDRQLSAVAASTEAQETPAALATPAAPAADTERNEGGESAAIGAAPAAAPAAAPHRSSRTRASQTRPSADPAPAAPRTRPARGQRVSASELQEQRNLSGYADRVQAVLASRQGTAGATVIGAEREGEEVVITIRAPQAVAAVQDSLMDVCAAFNLPDLDAAVDGDLVTLWVPKVPEERVKQVAAWVPAELRERSRRHSERTGETVTQQVLTAFNLHYEDLKHWFKAPEQVAGPMGINVQPRRREHAGTQVQLYLYLKPSQRALLDARYRQVGAASRSDLVTELLDRYLN